MNVKPLSPFRTRPNRALRAFHLHLNAPPAEEIRTDPSNVTRRLSGLEDRLGVRLINRSRPVDSN